MKIEYIHNLFYSFQIFNQNNWRFLILDQIKKPDNRIQLNFNFI